MAAENHLQGAFRAFQQGFNRLTALFAGLSFWQFVLVAIVLLAAAGIAESLWDKPKKHRIRTTEDRSAAREKRDTTARNTRGRDKQSITAEIHIDQDGVVIRRKPAPADKASTPPVAAPDPGKSEAQGSATPSGAPDRQPSEQAPGAREKEIRIGRDGVTVHKPVPDPGDASDAADEFTDIADEVSAALGREIARSARPPPLVQITLIVMLALLVIRIVARGQQRAEKKADAALAVADRETLQRQIVEARLQLLQAQVEPHFLFNTLASVEHLIETTPARAALMQRHLIDYLRAALPRMRQQSATLGQEVELCVSYLKIMQMRMEERIKFNVTVPAGLASAAFPPMMIQSLIENSIRHGLEPKPEGGVIILMAEVRDGELCVSVTDTGMGFSPNAGAGIGLANIRERLQQLFGAKGALTMEPNSPAGTRAVISVPYAVA